jgi:hypothetical protein
VARTRASQRVLDLVRGSVTVERGPARPPAGDRAAIVASWGPDARVSRSLDELIRALDAAGYPSVLVRASDDRAPLRWPSAPPASTIVVRKPNIGYDFGSWTVGLDRFPALARRRHVILVNDSMVGPFAPLDDMITSFETTGADVWGATNTRQFVPHLQSYLLGFQGGALADPAVRQFWRSVDHLDDKSRIIGEYELGLSHLLRAEGLTSRAWFASERVVSPTDNPVITGWRRLVELGFPFVKREVIRDPSIVADGHLAPEVIRERFGAEVADWL